MSKIQDQPAPLKTGGRPIWELVIADMAERDQVGRRRCGTPLQAHNGRDALVDAYQEALDLVVYLRQAIEERDADPTSVRVAAEAVLACGVGNLSGPKYRARVAAFDALDDAVERDQ